MLDILIICPTGVFVLIPPPALINGPVFTEGATHPVEKSDYCPAKPGRSRTSTLQVRGTYPVLS